MVSVSRFYFSGNLCRRIFTWRNTSSASHTYYIGFWLSYVVVLVLN